MTWVANTDWGGWVWEVGTYTGPSTGELLPAPDSSLLQSYMGELDYVTSFSTGDSLHLNDFDGDSRTYRSGGGFGSFETHVNGSFAFYVVVYNLTSDSPNTWGPPGVDGNDLVPASLSSGGTAGSGPPPTPPVNDNFADRIVLSGPCGQVSVDTADATVEGWESTYPTGHTVWYEWTSPYTGIVLFRSAFGSISVRLWTGLTSGHPSSVLAYEQVYAGEWMTWVSVTSGQTLYLQVDDRGGTTGDLRWQQLADVPQQTVYGYTTFESTGISYDLNSDGYPVASGSGDLSNPLLARNDNSLVGFLNSGTYTQYSSSDLADGLAIVPMTRASGSDPVPADAVIDELDWGAWNLIGAGRHIWLGADYHGSAGFCSMGNAFASNTGSTQAAYFLSGLAGSGAAHFPTTAEIIAETFTILLGTPYPIPGGGTSNDHSADQLVFTVNWHHLTGAPVPAWSCAIPPLRQLQRDDVTRQFTRNGPSSLQASIRQGPRGTYL